MAVNPIARLMFAAVLSACAVASAQAPPELVILDAALPPLEAGNAVRIALHAAGGVPPYHWSMTAGDLPEGVLFSPDGVLSGRPTRPGNFAITVMVTDSSQPVRSASKDFSCLVTAALLLEWLRPPAIHGNQIDGAVQVSNGSQDKLDLTVFIVAVNEIGRATALRYERLNLAPGTNNFPISFTETLPPGTYVVHADAVAEIPPKNVILRQRLQTPAALPITQGP